MNGTSPLKLLKILLLLSISLNTTFAVSAEVYKWIDQDGNTHYSDKKPHNTDSTSIKIKNSKNKQQAKTEKSAKPLDEKAARAAQAQQAEVMDEARQKEIKEKCATIRANLKIIAETSRIRVVEDGNTRYLSPEEIAAKKSRHEQQIKEFCM